MAAKICHFFVHIWANTHQTNKVTLPLTFEVTAQPQWWCGSLYSICIPSLKISRPCRSKDMADFWSGRYLPGDLDFWPFDLYGVMGNPCHPANFQLPMPFHSRLSVRHRTDGLLDRCTDNGQHCIMPRLHGALWQHKRFMTLHFFDAP